VPTLFNAWRPGVWRPLSWRAHAWAEVAAPTVATVVAMARGYYGNKLRLPGEVFVMQFTGAMPEWVVLNDGRVPTGSIGAGTAHRQARTFECADESVRVLDGYHGVKIRTKHGWRMA
jgi:hypothetical protein